MDADPNDHDPSRRGARPRRPRLARQLSHVLVRRLLRPGAHGLPRAARDQRGPRRAGQGFGTHPTATWRSSRYVLEGALAHKDSMGTGSVIRPGDVQRMTRGHRRHAQRVQRSKTEPVHFLQIWIVPAPARLASPATSRRRSPRPSAGQAAAGRVAGRARRLGDRPPGRGAVRGAARCRRARWSIDVRPSRHAWLHVARGAVA